MSVSTAAGIGTLFAMVVLTASSIVGPLALQSQPQVRLPSGASPSAQAVPDSAPLPSSYPTLTGYPVSTWSQFHGNESHDGLSSWPGPTIPKILWHQPLGGTTSGLTSSDGNLVVTTYVPDQPDYEDAGSIEIASETTGAELLAANVPGGAPCGVHQLLNAYTPVGLGAAFYAYHSVIYLDGCDTAVLGSDSVANGNTNWWTSGIAGGGSSPYYGSILLTYSDGYVYSVGFESSNGVQAFLASSGSLAWSYAPAAGATDTFATIGGGLLVVGNSGVAQISALNMFSGSLAWDYGLAGGIVDAAPAYYQGNFFFGTTASQVYDVSSTGALAWSQTLAGPVESTPAIANGLLYVGADSGVLYALNLTTGAVQWSHDVGGSLIASPVASSNDVVYAASTTGALDALNGTTGRLLWAFSDSYPITASPILDEGRLFIEDQSGSVYAFSQAATFPVTFVESGLAAGTSWSVSLNGTEQSTKGPSLTFYEPNGSFQYSVSTATGYLATPSSGSLVVYGSAVAQPVVFSIEISRVTVRVVDSSGNDIVGSSVELNGTTLQTNSSGQVAFLVADGEYEVTAMDVGFVSANQTITVSSNTSLTLTLARPYRFLGVIPSQDIAIALTSTGYQVGLVNMFSASPSEVLFDWDLVGTLAAGGGWVYFGTSQLPTLVVMAASSGSVNYPYAWYAQPLSPELSPTNGTTGPFPSTATPFASGSISVVPDPPVVGQPTTLSVTLQNPYAIALPIDQVDFQVSGLNVGSDGGWQSVGVTPGATLQPGQTETFSTVWVADASGHHCVRVVVAYSYETSGPLFQTMQHNYDLEPDILPGQAGSVSFILGNPLPEAESAEISVTEGEPWPTGWSTSLEINGDNYGETSGVILTNLPPGAVEPSTLTITPAPGVLGSASVDIMEYINGQLVGGLEKQMQEAPAPSFWATPVSLAPSAPSQAYSFSTFLGQGFCGYSGGVGLAGCASVSWDVSGVSGCVISSDDPLVETVQSGACNGAEEVAIPATSTDTPEPYQFTLAYSFNGTPTTEALTIFALPSMHANSGSGSSLTESNTQFDPVDCNRLIAVAGCWVEFGPPPPTDDLGLAVAGSAGAGLITTLGSDLDSATATYPTPSLIPSDYVSEYYDSVDTWTLHAEYCGTPPIPYVPSSAGSTYQVFTYDSAGASFNDEAQSSYCANLGVPAGLSEAIEAGIDEVEQYLEIDPQLIEDVETAAQTAGKLVQGIENVAASANCVATSASLSELCEVLGGLAVAAQSSFVYFGENWSSEQQSPCSYSVSAAPLAAEASIGPSGAAQIAATISDMDITGIAVPMPSPDISQDCSASSGQGATISIIAPNTEYSAQSQIEGTVLDSTGTPVAGATVQLSVSEGILSSTSVTTSSNGMFSVVYEAPATGPSSVTVNAASGSASQGTTFTLAQPTSVVFTVTGTQGARDWSAALGGPAGSRLAVTSAVSASFLEPIGVFQYLIRGPAGYRVSGISPVGEVNVTGPGVGIAANLVKGSTFSISFHEKGLLKGTNWCVSLGWTTCTNGSAIRVANLTPASYPYAVSQVSGYASSLRVRGASAGTTGTLDLTDRSLAVAVRFAAQSAPVSLLEAGLAGGHRWKVTVSSGSPKDVSEVRSTRSNHITLELPNGTYNYSIVPITGYRVAPRSGEIVVGGQPLSINVSFIQQDFPVVLEESGLTPGTEWSATIGQNTVYSDTPTIVFSMPNGTYRLQVGGETGMKSSTSTSIARVLGSAVTVSVMFSPTSVMSSTAVYTRWALPALWPGPRDALLRFAKAGSVSLGLSGAWPPLGGSLSELVPVVLLAYTGALILVGFRRRMSGGRLALSPNESQGNLRG